MTKRSEVIKKQAGIRLAPPLYDRVLKLAQTESRTISNMLMILVVEALSCREQKSS
jgi:hypothetical protein